MSKYNPGVSPCGHRVLVFPVPTERKTASGIIIHDTSADREDMAQIDAIIVSIGSNAWKDQKCGDWAKVGDRVLIAKYAGLVRKGNDGKMYRIINDLDVVAVCEEN